MANWVLDAICLWAAASAVGLHVSLAALVIAYTAGMVAASLSPLPAGAGAIETAMVIGLTAGGASAATALAAQAGVAMVRAHQVEETRQTLEMVASIGGTRPPSRAERWM